MVAAHFNSPQQIDSCLQRLIAAVTGLRMKRRWLVMAASSRLPSKCAGITAETAGAYFVVHVLQPKF